MKVLLLHEGKIKEKSFVSLIGDYTARLRHYCTLEIREIKNIEERGEAESFVQKLRSDHHAPILLDPAGKSTTSPEFAQLLGLRRDRAQSLALVIAGPFGYSSMTKRLFSEQWSLSPLTFTHECCVLLVLEQLYRGFKILSGEQYHY